MSESKFCLQGYRHLEPAFCLCEPGLVMMKMVKESVLCIAATLKPSLAAASYEKGVCVCTFLGLVFFLFLADGTFIQSLAHSAGPKVTLSGFLLSVVSTSS